MMELVGRRRAGYICDSESDWLGGADDSDGSVAKW